MKSRLLALGLAVASIALSLSGVAYARNPHCAGGIQYVTQALRDKEKDPESWRRQMLKAIDQLNQCASEDPADMEAIGYLGQAYAEMDSAGPAGVAFDKAIAGLKAKGDKKVEMVTANRDHYFVAALNDGIAKINAAQTAWPDFSKEATTDPDKTLKQSATQKYEEARVSLMRAAKYKPTDTMAIRSLGSIDAFMGDFPRAEATFQAGLKLAPGDSALTSMIKLVRTSYARRLTDEKKFDQALAYYSDLVKADPSNPDLHLGLASAYFERARSKEGDARKPDFKLAGDEYAKASDLKGGDSDMIYNSGLSYRSAGEAAAAEKQLRAFLKMKPDDSDALSDLGSVLADLGKYNDAIQILGQGLAVKPSDKVLHRQLGGVYSKAGNNAKSSEHAMIYLALEKGAVKDKASAPAGSAEATTIASQGAPDEVRDWDADGVKYETLAYWKKKTVYTFKSGTLVLKSDWSTLGSSAPAATGKK